MRDTIRRRRWDDEDGMSLVEIMIAIFVLSVGLLALASVAITSIVNLRVSRGRQEATNAASATIEDLRRSDYRLIALDADVVAPGTCETANDEPIVTTDLPGATPRVRTFGPNGRVTVTTTISWFDEDTDEGCAHLDRGAKRVRVVAEWDDGDETFEVEESTVVAPVDRGLPAPDFRLGTPEVDVTFNPSELGEEKCVGHVLRNLGAADGYDFTVERTDSGSVVKTQTASGEFTTADGKVQVRAFLENPAVEPPMDPATYGVPSPQGQRYANIPAGLELLIDADGNDRPETDPAVGEELATGEQARLWICYLAESSLSIGDTAELRFTVHSQFDENRSEVVEHTFEVTKETRTYYLFDDDESAEGTSGPRQVMASDGTTYLPALPMGPRTTLQPERLGTASSLPNYDTDLDSRFPGLRLPPGVDSGTVAFDQQVEETTTFEDQLELDLFSASEEALEDFLDGDSGTDDDQTLRYRVRLQVLASDEQTVLATPLEVEFDDAHPTEGWRPMDRTFTLPGGALTVSADQYLRFEISCVDTSNKAGNACHLAYDHTSYPASVSMVVQ